jgi:hypothetical protein|tara:strand:+ start:192 stop:323 length:132 start_codon:yes stop_codon:yes gene_type:complete
METFTDADLEYMNKIEQEMAEHERDQHLFECGMTADYQDWAEC